MPKSEKTVTYEHIRHRATVFRGLKIPGDIIPDTKVVVRPNESVEIWSHQGPTIRHNLFKIGDMVFDNANYHGVLVAIKSKTVSIRQPSGRPKRCSLPIFVERNRNFIAEPEGSC